MVTLKERIIPCRWREQSPDGPVPIFASKCCRSESFEISPASLYALVWPFHIAEPPENGIALRKGLAVACHVSPATTSLSNASRSDATVRAVDRKFIREGINPTELFPAGPKQVIFTVRPKPSQQTPGLVKITVQKAEMAHSSHSLKQVIKLHAYY